MQKKEPDAGNHLVTNIISGIREIILTTKALKSKDLSDIKKGTMGINELKQFLNQRAKPRSTIRCLVNSVVLW